MSGWVPVRSTLCQGLCGHVQEILGDNPSPQHKPGCHSCCTCFMGYRRQILLRCHVAVLRHKKSRNHFGVYIGPPKSILEPRMCEAAPLLRADRVRSDAFNWP